VQPHDISNFSGDIRTCDFHCDTNLCARPKELDERLLAFSANHDVYLWILFETLVDGEVTCCRRPRNKKIKEGHSTGILLLKTVDAKHS
jgi:hypothetical protein